MLVSVDPINEGYDQPNSYNEFQFETTRSRHSSKQTPYDHNYHEYDETSNLWADQPTLIDLNEKSNIDQKLV